MGECTYNTDHGVFRIDAKDVPEVEKALRDYLNKECSSTVYDEHFSLDNLLGEVRLSCEWVEGEDVLDIYLAGSSWDEEIEDVLTKVIAPFVYPGSYIVFYGGGVQGCWCVAWDKNPETDKVEGRMTDGEIVLAEDLAVMLEGLKDTRPDLYKKYS